MKKILKFCSIFLLAFLFFSYLGVSHSFATAPLCGACCLKGDCTPLTGKTIECIGALSGSDCNLLKNTGTGQCKISGETTFCPFSTKREVSQLVDQVSKWMLIVVLVVVPLMILFGAFYILTAAGDTKRSTMGKQIIVWALIGLAIFLFVKVLVSILRHFIGF